MSEIVFKMAPRPAKSEQQVELAITLIAALDSIFDRCGPFELAARLSADAAATQFIGTLRHDLEATRGRLTDAVLHAQNGGGTDDLFALLVQADRLVTGGLDWLQSEAGGLAGDETVLLDAAFIRALDISRQLRGAGTGS